MDLTMMQGARQRWGASLFLGGSLGLALLWLACSGLLVQPGRAGAWTIAVLLNLYLVGRPLYAWLSFHFGFRSRMQRALQDVPVQEQCVLLGIAWKIQRGREEEALVQVREHQAWFSPLARQHADWLRGWAGVELLRRRGEPISEHLAEPYPCLHALIFSPSRRRMPLEEACLRRELSEVTSAELDGLARAYVRLSEHWLQVLNGEPAPLRGLEWDGLGALSDLRPWWRPRSAYLRWRERFLPLVARGGGAFLVILRLMHRERWKDARQMAERLSQTGMLSAATERLAQVARFHELLDRRQWRFTPEEVPRFFQHYYYAACVGLEPALTLPFEFKETARWCRDAEELQGAKNELVEDLFQLWKQLEPNAEPFLAPFFQKLLDLPRRRPYGSPRYWRAQWRRNRPYEDLALLLMQGCARVHAKDYVQARASFEQATRNFPKHPSAWANLVYVCLLEGKDAEARSRALEVETRFPKNARVMVSLGKMFLQARQDLRQAELFLETAFRRDRDLLEALVLLGRIKLLEGDYPACQAWFLRVLEHDPQAAEARLSLGRLYFEIRRHGLAIEHLLAAARDGQGEIRAAAHYQLYKVFRDKASLARRDEPAEYLRRAVKHLDQVPAGFFQEPDELDEIAFQFELDHDYSRAKYFSERALLLRLRAPKGTGQASPGGPSGGEAT
jgi:tetratricopeptide (TPR) repeat protein